MKRPQSLSTVVLSLALLFAVLAFFMRAAGAQGPTLDERVASLELRVTTLEAALARIGVPESYSTPGAGDWQSPNLWRSSLRRGMTKAEVERVLGPPDKVAEIYGGLSIWYYGYPGGGDVSFDDDRVTGWSEP